MNLTSRIHRRLEIQSPVKVTAVRQFCFAHLFGLGPMEKENENNMPNHIRALLHNCYGMY
jgi:hypothetical protein